MGSNEVLRERNRRGGQRLFEREGEMIERTFDGFLDVDREVKVLLYDPVRLGVGFGEEARDLVVLEVEKGGE